MPKFWNPDQTDDAGNMNLDRSINAGDALDMYLAHKNESDDDRHSQITDLISDLLHHAAYHGADQQEIDGILRVAAMNFEEERN